MNGPIWQTRTATADPSSGPGAPRAGASTIDNPTLTAVLLSCHFTCQRKPGSSALSMRAAITNSTVEPSAVAPRNARPSAPRSSRWRPNGAAESSPPRRNSRFVEVVSSRAVRVRALGRAGSAAPSALAA
jgi:hypothetical protein